MIGFDGITDGISRGAGAYNQNVAGGTIMAWARPGQAAPGGNHTIVYCANGLVAATNRLLMRQNAANLVSAARALDADLGSTITHGNPPWSLTVAKHQAISCSYAAATGDGFTNGVLTGAGAYAAMTPGNTSNTASLALGAGVIVGGGSPWEGHAGDARLYDYAMTIDEIAGIFACRGTDGRWGQIVSRHSMADNAPGVVVTNARDWSNNNFDLNTVVDTPTYNEYFTRRRRKVN